jgi:2-polyprenyl-3-methyl-5-hydroxy-6-metoxy-1,4-benzoquinol methylase
LHGHLRKHAAHCLGVDVLEEEVKHLRELGYNVIFADIAKSPLSEKFDVIVCGEVLEHVDAPGMFMKNCASMLNSSGRLVISVPNPWYINVIVKNAFTKYPFVDSADHVGWYDSSTLFELGERYGLRLERFSGIAVHRPKSLRAKILFDISPLICVLGVAPELFAKYMIYEFVLK